MTVGCCLWRLGFRSHRDWGREGSRLGIGESPELARNPLGLNPKQYKPYFTSSFESNTSFCYFSLPLYTKVSETLRVLWGLGSQGLTGKDFRALYLGSWGFGFQAVGFGLS